MDFLDPKKQKAHAVRLIIGYVLIGLVLLLATLILLYQAFGFGIDRHGRIIQNGLIFMSSTPEGAEIYVNGKKENNNTNTRLLLPAGQYTFELKREGYRPWKRAITVEGGTVQRFEYPFLFPDQLVTSTTRQYGAMPSLITQSEDRRWLLVQSGTADSFDLYDLDADNPTPQPFTVPAEILSANTATLGWEEVEWAGDNRHAVLKRIFDRAGQQGSEYVLIDREDAGQSVNLSVTLGFTPTVLELRGQAYDQYYAYDQQNRSLFTASLEQPTPQPYLDNVLGFESDGEDTVLYATSENAPPGKTLIRMRQGDDHYTIRQVASDAAPYLLDLARFDGAWYVAAGASAEDKVYVYKNPIDELKSDDGDVLVPAHILKVNDPNYLSFAPGARFVVAENGPQFAVYDAKNDKGYAYQLKMPVNSALGHATWANSYYLQLISNGQVMIFDYDGANRETLVPANPATLPVFDRQYRFLYTMTDANALTSTALRTERDQ